MDKGYPIIKCNVNQATKEKIYHLPFDQQYDRTQINASMNEFYATTCAEAENRGFCRAMKYFDQNFGTLEFSKAYDLPENPHAR